MKEPTKSWAEEESDEDGDEYEDEQEQGNTEKRNTDQQEAVGYSKNRTLYHQPRSQLTGNVWIASVSNIHFGTNEGELCKHFETRNCKISKVNLHLSQYGKPNGTADIEFADEQSFNACLNASGTMLRGLPIKTSIVVEHGFKQPPGQQRAARYDNAVGSYGSEAGARHDFASNEPYRVGGSRYENDLHVSCTLLRSHYPLEQGWWR